VTTDTTHFDKVAPDQSPKLTSIVSDALRRKIVSGELAEGDNLPPELELVAQFGVSRPTLREALRILESESLIRTRRGSRSGAEVCAPNVETSARYMGFVLQHEAITVDDVLQARMILEPPLAGLTAARNDSATILALRRALEAEAQALPDRASYAEASIRFHEVVVDLAGIRTLSLTVRQYNWVLGRLMQEVRTHDTEVTTGDPKSHSAHTRFVELVAEGNPREAESFWHAHVEAIGQRLLKGRSGSKVVDLFS
jgi:GntR family transcriptional repressor for pyruvate dehydrogenase complex